MTTPIRSIIESIFSHHIWQRDVPAAIDLFTEDGEMDTGDRLGMSELVRVARAKVTEARVSTAGDSVTLLGR